MEEACKSKASTPCVTCGILLSFEDEKLQLTDYGMGKNLCIVCSCIDCAPLLPDRMSCQICEAPFDKEIGVRITRDAKKYAFKTTSLYCSLRCAHRERKWHLDEKLNGMKTFNETCTICKIGLIEKKRCGACRLQFYCSKECQRKDWKEHKKTCPGKTK